LINFGTNQTQDSKEEDGDPQLMFDTAKNEMSDHNQHIQIEEEQPHSSRTEAAPMDSKLA